MVAFEPRLFEDIAPENRPSLAESLVPIVGMVVFLSVGIVGFGRLGRRSCPLASPRCAGRILEIYSDGFAATVERKRQIETVAHDPVDISSGRIHQTISVESSRVTTEWDGLAAREYRHQRRGIRDTCNLLSIGTKKS